MTDVQLPLGFEDSGSLEAPRLLAPMRIRLASQPFDSPDYLFETRWNGIRALATIEQGRVSLYNRRQGELSARFPELSALALSATEQPLLLDGEIVAMDEHGKIDFDALHYRLRLIDPAAICAEAARRPACFLATDLLFRGRQSLLAEPLLRRKRQLAEALHPADCLYLGETFEDEGRALYQAAVQSELEGLVAKPKAAPYTPGDFGGGWLAVPRDCRELVIGGCSLRIAGSARKIELLLGAYDDSGKLAFVTIASPPQDEHLRNELFGVLNALQMDAPPFAEPPAIIAFWVRPEVVVTVRFEAEGGPAAFERIRLDVAADECLLPVDAPLATRPQDPRPQLTLLNTLPLPLDVAPAPAPRPFLRVVGQD